MIMSEHGVWCLSPSGFHRMHYTEWPARQSNGHPPKVLICVHGLTRNGRDFDFLAQALSSEYTVICPDVAGRGRSDWLAHEDDYGYPQYLADMTALIARSGAAEIDWVGTSMGGLIGMLLAARPRTPIRKLVINDVGPFIPQAALARIGAYVGRMQRFASLAQMEDYLREIAAPFGPLTDAQWRHLTKYSARRLDGQADGEVGYTFAYDPAIAGPFKRQLDDIDLWPVWAQVSCPTLVLRGSESDVLRHDDAVLMTQRGPCAELVEFAGVGHAPALMDEHQIGVVRAWLVRD